MQQEAEGVTIGIVAGEASGDALGAQLVEAVRARLPQARFVGIAGPRLEAAGCEAWYPTSRLSVGGYVEVVRALPGLLRMRRELAQRLLAAKARLFIGVDAPDFNLGLEAGLKRRGVRTIHYVSPSVWAWRSERIHTIARSADRLLALFPFEPSLYAAAGLPVTFVGHRLAATAATAASRRETRELLRLDTKQPVFALLPGSRMAELEMHSDLLLDAAGEILAAQPTAQFLVPLISRETREHFDAVRYRRQRNDLPLTILYGHADQALCAADVGLVASGTATLEAAMSRCPHVIFYRINALSGRLIARKLLLPYVGLPNVLAGRFVVPEFLQGDATAGNLSRAVLNLFDDALTRRRLEALFAAMARMLAADTPTLVADAVTAELQQAGVRC
ncbi:MAG TPA: lipid-A-disaccharide synthase [Casimicrobiaceae bacterium]|jgi:lipid-A-disaccharide synthase|nr:lipid-A-disaccharide synthase [Casimicrobiaceae bacterium]